MENKLKERATPLEQMRAILDSDYYDKVVVESRRCEETVADVSFV